ncbi:MAG: hypothetical protein ACYC0P_01735 [Thiobacillus sp.]
MAGRTRKPDARPKDEHERQSHPDRCRRHNEAPPAGRGPDPAHTKWWPATSPVPAPGKSGRHAARATLAANEAAAAGIQNDLQESAGKTTLPRLAAGLLISG